MQNLVAQVLPELRSHRLNGVDLGEKAMAPFYHGYSIANLPASVCQWLGAPPLAGETLGPAILDQLGQRYNHVVLMLLDGLGLDMFQLYTAEEAGGRPAGAWRSLLPDALLAPLTSIAPSTTAAALTTLWTGCPPAQHGVMGYEVWLKEYSLVANMIHHSAAMFGGDTGGLRRAGFQAEAFLPTPVLGPHLLAHGVEPYAYMPASIARSGLSSMHLNEVNVVPYVSMSDLWVSLERVLETRAGDRTYNYVYWSELDTLSHRYGPEDERVGLEFAFFSIQLERFLTRLKRQGRGDTLVLLTADHGELYTPILPTYDLKNHPELLSCLSILPSGEARLAYLYVRPGCEARLQAYVEQTWPGQFRILPAAQALEAGLWGDGQVYPAVKDRIGDYVLQAQGNAYWWWAHKENPLLGRHGGLTPKEMLVPLLAMVV
ncbi:MAG: alkaline phosphatase family protein [Anaerolineaceae bacterium]|nr:alkaline phosphatase family protein [Anaerolineaceae bacterium]